VFRIARVRAFLPDDRSWRRRDRCLGMRKYEIERERKRDGRRNLFPDRSTRRHTRVHTTVPRANLHVHGRKGRGMNYRLYASERRLSGYLSPYVAYTRKCMLVRLLVCVYASRGARDLSNESLRRVVSFVDYSQRKDFPSARYGLDRKRAVTDYYCTIIDRII
jgi:hypothetical protein